MAESFVLVFEHGMMGISQHCAEKHLHRYFAKSDFRPNHWVTPGVGCTMRAEATLLGLVGKRLAYRPAR